MAMHMGHVALAVTDLGRSVAHAEATLGLRVTEAQPAEALLTANEKHHELQLIRSAAPGLDHVGLEVESVDELEGIRGRLREAGRQILSESPEEDGLGSAFRTLGPADIVFEIYVGMERAPLSVDNSLSPVARKFGHVTFYSDRKDEIESYLIDLLDFRVSDKIGDVVSWLRCDPDHHGIAIGRGSAGTSLHHYAFELESWATVGAYADRVARNGESFLWGPGRHGAGFNIFTYLLDPDGTVVEAYTDMLRIEDEANYREFGWDIEDPRALNLWGPGMPADWADLGIPVVGPR